jgi:hypothetical protein
MSANQCTSCGRQTRSYWKLHQHLKRCPSHHAAALAMRYAGDLTNTEYHPVQDVLAWDKDFQVTITSAWSRQPDTVMASNVGGQLRDQADSIIP